MSTGFVGHRVGVTGEELDELLKQGNDTYYFLKYVDRVSGFCTQLPEKSPLSPQGQMFDRAVELRWKQRGKAYDLLWLGTKEPPAEFEPIEGDWTYCDRQAKVYSKDETRLPRTIAELPKNLVIQQRYFLDKETATVHFVALTVK
jgi:hypothetical protein